MDDKAFVQCLKKHMAGEEIGKKRMRVVGKKSNRTKKFPKVFENLQKGIENFSNVLRSDGFKINSEPSEFAKECFLRLPQGAQRKILQNFIQYAELIEELKRQNRQSLSDARQVTWAFLKKLNLQPCSNTFSQIESTDLIEIYSRGYIQIFRSLKFFEHYQCSVFDLLVLDWMTLFKREATIEEKIFFNMEACFKGLPRARSFEGIRNHEVRERFSTEPEALIVSLKTCSPLMSRSKKIKKAEVVLVTSVILGPEWADERTQQLCSA